MIEMMVDYMLGPIGNKISAFYLDHQTVINSLVVGATLIQLYIKRDNQTNSESKTVLNEQS
ncbi:hypothetical protein [Pontibacillus yanchengensis]|uniref:Uncharacterized protein n=1 Tax=Pontibacillus yanchengensis Y32 TaxID=1385514 RepID=A0A0A2TDB3_9BACI|nr:hypothetical protein [Pontibacillus yanchengensis]KGP72383.1 hypothetical protein N782_12035 [Pontibacillus yanchengensis Y32]